MGDNNEVRSGIVSRFSFAVIRFSFLTPNHYPEFS